MPTLGEPSSSYSPLRAAFITLYPSLDGGSLKRRNGTTTSISSRSSVKISPNPDSCITRILLCILFAREPANDGAPDLFLYYKAEAQHGEQDEHDDSHEPSEEHGAHYIS